ncbi:MAG: substrate-binding domain-containing protein [Candidatus Eremiobacteraeota bacterium]|nr:substrate-binding domain-containing protein [Candidatus Eremiobacteraeota bacterium]MCW5869922.1 substrate-binding domain-containing protein [Candidatus Eremiobacteraeota bacterium]
MARPRVALLVDLATSFGRRLLEGVHSHPARQQWDLLAESWGDVGAADLLDAGSPAGIILDSQSPELLQTLNRVDRPIVDLTGAVVHPRATSVTTDYRQVGQVAAQHMKERGFANLAFLGLRRSQPSEQIGQAFAAAARSWARRVDRFKTPRDWSGQQNHQRRALAEWVQSLPRPCGVLAADDVAAHRLLQICWRLELEVPQQLAVLGVGDYEIVSKVCDPSLSSVVIPAREIGVQAAACLARLMAGQTVAPVKLPAPAVAARRSTDLLAFEDDLLRRAVDWMNGHLAETIRVPQLADHLCVSRRLLEQHFQDVLGYGPAEQLRRIRLHQAERLLRETDLGLASVARMTGLGTAERLCVLFRQYLQLTPGEYRRMLPAVR